MPYIEQEDRDAVDIFIDDLLGSFDGDVSFTPGMLNYLVTSLAHGYIERKGKNYTHLNDVVGVLESAKTEFNRRVVASYEDKKIKENGDL